MMKIEQLVEDIRKSYGDCELEELAKLLGVYVYQRYDFDQLKGMYAIIAKRRCIFINAKLCEEDYNLVLAHELGHDQLHRSNVGIQDLMEYTLFQLNNEQEYEANLFAAHLLLREEELLPYVKEGFDLQSLAQMFKVDARLLLMKLHAMKKKGYPFHLEEMPYADFLGRKPI